MYRTEQEDFWAGEFGNEYITRNQGDKLLASNLNFFSKAFNQVKKIENCIEFGANIGMNLKALNLLYPNLNVSGVEINKKAYEQLIKITGPKNAFNTSIFDVNFNSKFDMTLIKGVLIHINPEMLEKVYDQLYHNSKRYILIAEYYNPKPVTIEYRGHKEKLFKRDFAGEFLDRFKDTYLVDYGFSYHRDNSFPQDDITWFLIEKK